LRCGFFKTVNVKARIQRHFGVGGVKEQIFGLAAYVMHIIKW